MASAQMVQAGGISLAIRTLHSFLPLVVAVSFAISYIASALRKNDHGGKLHGGRSREIVLWMISTVLTTYVSVVFEFTFEADISFSLMEIA